MELEQSRAGALASRSVVHKALVLVNPSGSLMPSAEIRSLVAEALVPVGASLEVVEIRAASELDEAVERARRDGYEMVVVAGDDATVARAAQHLAASETLLAMVPVGRDNTLAHDLGIPADVHAAVALLSGEYEIGYLDALKVGDRYFFLQVGTAAPLSGTADNAQVAPVPSSSADQPLDFHSHRFSLEVDGTHSRASGWQVIVVNTGGLRSLSFQSGSPNRPSDHVAELAVLRLRSNWDLIRAAFGRSKGKRDSGISINYHRVHEKAVIVPDESMPIQGDGEPIGSTPLEVIVVPKAVRVVVPIGAAAVTAPEPSRRRESRRFRQALLRGLSPVGALDTALYLAIGRLPHPRPLNLLMQSLERGMASGQGYVAGILLMNAPRWSRVWREELNVAPLIWLTSATTEWPIKRVFARPRPFVSIVLAPVVGRKPSSHSFPSGHSASAFAGAWLLSRRYPRLTPAFYAFAALVAFSRVYQGAHYPSDVAIGGLVGTTLAATYRWAFGRSLGSITSLARWMR